MKKITKLSAREDIVWVCHEGRLTFIFLEKDESDIYLVTGSMIEQLDK